MSQTSLSSLIWSVADLLRGDYKPHEYGRVILPFTVLRRLDCVLAPTKPAVLQELAAKQQAGLNPEPFLLRAARLPFVNIVQNKLHFAATGQTAPEPIASRADAAKPNMGLTAWKGGSVRKGDVTVAKNYLNEQEIAELNRIVVMFLDFAEDQARRRKQIFLNDWKTRLDDFLRFNGRAVPTILAGGRIR